MNWLGAPRVTQSRDSTTTATGSRLLHQPGLTTPWASPPAQSPEALSFLPSLPPSCVTPIEALRLVRTGVTGAPSTCLPWGARTHRNLRKLDSWRSTGPGIYICPSGTTWQPATAANLLILALTTLAKTL